MNERIRLLAEQANIEFTYDPTETPIRAFAGAFCWDGDLEKFAQLIVQKCITVLDQDDGATHHSELLLKHFGVEE